MSREGYKYNATDLVRRLRTYLPYRIKAKKHGATSSGLRTDLTQQRKASKDIFKGFVDQRRVVKFQR